MKRPGRILAGLLALCLLLCAPPAARAADGGFLRIFHLDAGRKYFSPAQIEAVIDMLAANGYTHLELALGNDALRFIPDDVSLTVNGRSYSDEQVRAGIAAGNRAYYNDPNGSHLTESEMDAIIAYAKERKVGIIPLVNAPGHMDAIIDAMEAVGISNPAYSRSARTVDVTNGEATAFTLALLDVYVRYFAAKGATIFNMGCDEYANDRYSSGSMGFGNLISTGRYGSFISFVNAMAAQIEDAGMTPMAFNDGIYFNNNRSSGTFDTNILIAYWTSGWTNYSVRSAANLAADGFRIVNTNDAWYYVLGRASGGYSLQSAKSAVTSTKATSVSGSSGVTPAGSMACVWCDTPSASYTSAEEANLLYLIEKQAAANPDLFTAVTDSPWGGGDEPEPPGGTEEPATDPVTPPPAHTGRIDLTVPENLSLVTIENRSSAEIVEGRGLRLVSTKDAIEPCNGQLSGSAATTPKDLVKISAPGDWTATVKFAFSRNGSQGYYEFFGFYAADDYSNLLGLRAGDGSIQDFRRVNGGITAETNGLKTSSGLKSASTHWLRIAKAGGSYDCFWSTDGENFTKVCSYSGTGITGDTLILDAYSGMATGYEYLIEYVDVESACSHRYTESVVDPTCEAGGCTLRTCSLCGDVVRTDETAKLGHDYRDGVCVRCGAYQNTPAEDPPETGVLAGDVNGDGRVTASDRILLSRHLEGMAGFESLPSPAAADLNGDGRVSIRDRVLLARLLAGWQPPSPAS